ncbi:hypothetical protein QBZ16_003337 [Prototheca wickerhamii]|uniref:Uncharacterized protein n=1 Tax=Prototheca wickerhamii TaxID=3111 RepID=A0AAD9MIJ0_PROWI|nr:hypothetical protein QBZ16_003337 [Prototheca wickerhamii]
MVVVISPAAAIAAQSLFPDAEADGDAASSSTLLTCDLLRLAGQDVLAVLTAPPPDEQAQAVARSLLRALRPKRVIVAGTLLPRDLRGPIDEGHEPQLGSEAPLFALTSGGESLGAGSSAAFRAAPPSLLVQGLPAALLTRGTVTDLPTLGLLSVQAGQVPDAPLCAALARGLLAALEQGKGELPAQALARIAAACDTRYRSSAASSMFI